MVSISNLSEKTNFHEEALKKEKIFTIYSCYSEQTAMSSQLFIPLPLLDVSMMAIRMIYY